MNWYKKAQEEEYRGIHEAPMRDSGSPMHDLTDIYPDDIYSGQGAVYYGHYGRNHPVDLESISMIRDAKNNPNQRVKIYRAVPDINLEINQEIKSLSDIVAYYYKFNFFPMKNEIVYQVTEKYPIEKYEYDEQQKLILQDISNQIEDLKSKKQGELGINVGDWVTISRSYAKEHGESNLKGKYKIISKTVKASDIFTEGDSIQEWGYDPQ